MLTMITTINGAVHDVYLIEHVTIAILEWGYANSGTLDCLKRNGIRRRA